MEKFSNATLFRQIALQNLQRKNLGFSETVIRDLFTLKIQEVLKRWALSKLAVSVFCTKVFMILCSCNERNTFGSTCLNMEITSDTRHSKVGLMSNLKSVALFHQQLAFKVDVFGLRGSACGRPFAFSEECQ